MKGSAQVSRRGFLAGASIVGIAGTTGVAALDGTYAQANTATPSATSEPTIPNDEIASVAVDPFGVNGRGSYTPNMGNVVPIPAIKEPDFYDYETDILLIGYGVGGTSAALTAANRGLQVVAMERSSYRNWNEHAGVTEVVCVGAPEWREKLGIEEWSEEFITNYVIGKCKTPPSADDLKAAVTHLTNQPLAFQQIRDLGYGCQFVLNPPLPAQEEEKWPAYLPLNDNLSDGGSIYYPWKNTYHAVEHVIDRYNQEHGTTVLWNTMALNLIVDESGAVVGAKGNDWVEGRDVYVKAKAVIDCCGGYAANYDMITYYGGSAVEGMGCNVGGLVNDGMGMRMCQGAGCGVRALPRQDNNADAGIDVIGLGLPWNYIDNEPSMPDKYLSGAFATEIVMGRQPSLRVNVHGQRFMDEDGPWNEKVWIANKQPGHRFFTILDGNLDAMVDGLYNHETGTRYGLCEHPLDSEHYIYFDDNDIRPFEDWHLQFDRAVEKGLIIKADTLEELADACGINKENFLATVTRYNELCELGEDLDFGKLPEALYPIATPPFYACDRKPGIPWTMAGGVSANAGCQVLNVRGEVIPGLYVGAVDAAICDVICDDRYTKPVMSHAASAQTYGYTAACSACDAVEALGTIGQTIVSEQRHDTDSRAVTSPEEARAGLDYMLANCTVCHSVPTEAQFSPYASADDITAVFTDHDGFPVSDEDAQSVAAWVLR